MKSLIQYILLVLGVTVTLVESNPEAQDGNNYNFQAPLIYGYYPDNYEFQVTPVYE